MPSTKIITSSSVADLLRAKRKELSLTLAEVSARITEEGERLPPSTLARIEQGKFDPGVRRMHALLRLYEISPQVVADLVALEATAAPAPAFDDLEALYREGVSRWKAGDVRTALAYLAAVRKHVPVTDAHRVLRQRALLGFAVVAKNLGKFSVAKQLVEDLLSEPPDQSLLVSVLVLASGIWLYRNSLASATAYIGEAERQLDGKDPQQSAYVLHQKARILHASGRPAESLAVLDDAAAVYERVGDLYGAAKARLARIKPVEAVNGPEAALVLAKAEVVLAHEAGTALLSAMARVESGRLLHVLQRQAEAISELRAAVDDAVAAADRHIEFHAHYWLWRAYSVLGQSVAASKEFESAAFFVRFADDLTPEANEIRSHLGP